MRRLLSKGLRQESPTLTRIKLVKMKVRFVTTILIVFLSHFSSANDLSLDSLYSLDYRDKSKVKRELELFEKRKLSLSEKQKLIFAKSYYLSLWGDFKGRIKLLNSYEWDKAEDNIKVGAYYQLTESYVNLGNLEKALYYTSKVTEILPNINEPKLKSLAYHSIADVYESLYMFEESYLLSEMIIQEGYESRSSEILCYGTSRAIKNLFRLKRFPEIIKNKSAAIRYCGEINDRFIIELITPLIQISNNKLNSDFDGIARLISMYDNLEVSSSPREFFELELFLAEYYLQTDNIERAYNLYQSAYSRSSDKGDYQFMIDGLDGLFKVSLITGDSEAALYYAKILIDNQKEFERELVEKSRLFNSHKIRAKELEHQISKLSLSNENLILEREVLNSQKKVFRVAVFSAFAGILILTLVIYLLVRQKIRMKKSLDTDFLTGAISRSSVLSLARKKLKACKENGENFSIVTFDLDNFKSINDRFGHSVGDWVLLTVIKTIKLNIRENDFVGRLGGEEFIICLPNSELSQALVLAERCREALEKINTKDISSMLVITASFGVSEINGEVDSLNKLLVESDRCLYAAKSKGRNCISSNYGELEKARITAV
ncbi:GGDEF domain-containing protein [Ferrimonas aestuarii]|uniref:diguanylate cyclase n=2 Tax=Ferrimonas aestuarii TaxID=2569539 RepID=A0A4U1BPQ3_9GAMM|nr:GGDEF domain-containing protein [Ferrimonas aestuarii]